MRILMLVLKPTFQKFKSISTQILITIHDTNTHIQRCEDDATRLQIALLQGNVRRLPVEWTNRFDWILEKGLLDAVYLSSGDPQVVLEAVQNLHRVLKTPSIDNHISMNDTSNH